MPRTDGSGVPWWREAVIYQIYPLSFADSNGDGYGDLAGITERLDYVSDTLGADAIWLSPFYKSPMRDWGYDVSDHTDVDPLFGNLNDVITLIDRAHELGLKVIVDYVINHTSYQHRWFQESSSSRDNPKRDWYVWRDGRDDGPPNNWVSLFGGPMWSFDETTGQWYRHTFLSSQPDLNWRNSEVVEAMMDIARFWLDLDVDGFRIDAAHHMMKDPRERDNPPVPPDHQPPWKDMGEYDEFLHLYDGGHPDVHEAHRTFRKVVDTYGRDVLTIGEMHIFDLPEWATYYGEDLDEFSMPFNFHLMAANWDVPSVRAAVEAVLWTLPKGAWTNWTLGNHDETRMASRLPEGHERIAATLILTLRGTPFLYYGDELGMRETIFTDHRSKDPWGNNVEGLSRDGARTPMQWTPEPNAGFTAPGAEAWLPVSASSRTVNVETQLADENSLLNVYRRLLALRKRSPALRFGSFRSHPASTDEVFVYLRESNTEVMTVALNFGSTVLSMSIGDGRVVFSSHDHLRAEQVDGEVELSPEEAIILTRDRFA
jgi:alpha-glucosidase